jgi:hypothetical protein
MRAWTDAELRRFDAASSLRLSAGGDGQVSVELGMVTVDRDLVVRAFSGVGSRWFQAALESEVGTIEVDGRLTAVRFHLPAVDDRRIEAAYRQRYGAAAGLVATEAARAATLLITPDAPR